MSTEVVQERVLAKLDEIRARYEAVAAQMNRPEVASDAAQIVRLAKEHGQLRRVMEPYEAYQKVIRQIRESQVILDDPGTDAELKGLAREEMAEGHVRADGLMETLKKVLLTSDDAVVDSVILEIRAGTGGEEAALFARDLYDMYLRYCGAQKLAAEVLDASPSDLGGFKEIILNIKGPGVYQQLRYEAGGHRVQRVPDTEAQGRIHTSAATVAVLPEPKEVDVQIDWEKDVIEHVSRAGGPGGQNVNKVSSAIKLEHVPTGITVSMRDEKSQHKNRAKARRVLLSRLYEAMMQEQTSARDATRRSMVGSGDRSERIRTYNFPQNRCTDHRVGLDLYSLDRIMQGEMDQLIRALQAFDLEQRLKNL